MGIESHILTPDEAQKLYPIMNKDDLVGALYSPTDGHIDPAGYCTALSRAAKLNGAQVTVFPPYLFLVFFVCTALPVISYKY